MGLDVLTACSINGVLSPTRGLARLGLIEALDVPPAVLDVQRGLRRSYDAVLVGPNTALLDQRLVEHIHLLLLPVVLDSGAINAFEGRPDPLPRLRLGEFSRFGDYVLLRYDVLAAASP